MVVQQASGKYIIWLDADMTLAPDYLENQVAYMEQHPNVGIAGGKYNVHIGHGLAADLENIVYAVDSVFGNRANASNLGICPALKAQSTELKQSEASEALTPKSTAQPKTQRWLTESDKKAGN